VEEDWTAEGDVGVDVVVAVEHKFMYIVSVDCRCRSCCLLPRNLIVMIDIPDVFHPKSTVWKLNIYLYVDRCRNPPELLAILKL